MVAFGEICLRVFLASMLVCHAASAQQFAAPQKQPPSASVASKASISTSQTQDMLAPVEKNFNYQPTALSEPKNDPQVFHIKITDGKVSVSDPQKRSILVYYDDYRIIRGFDNLTKCSIRVYVINDLTEKITSLGFKLHWPEISTAVEMNQVKPGIKTFTDLMLMGDGCLRLDKTPTIEVNRCRVKGMSQDDCADAIKWMPR